MLRVPGVTVEVDHRLRGASEVGDEVCFLAVLFAAGGVNLHAGREYPVDGNLHVEVLALFAETNDFNLR